MKNKIHADPVAGDNPVRIEVFKHFFISIAEEMGVVLRKSSFSPNIKERRDFSCAIFDPEGKLIAQAAHIPVHLGSMPFAVSSVIKYYTKSYNQNNSSKLNLSPGDMVIINNPYLGGTHLPDITLISPVFIESKLTTALIGFIANRAHHADIGGITPGSMPLATELFQEGLIIPPVKLVNKGVINDDILNLILSNVRTPGERAGDISAQIAANLRGTIRLQELVSRYGIDQVHYYMESLMSYTERMTRNLISKLKDGVYSFTDYLDNDGISNDPIPISVEIIISGDQASIDFSHSAPQQKGSINAVYSITVSAIYYVIRCLINSDVPENNGILAPINIHIPEASVVNASYPAPVAGGNVETSQRIVDVLFGAFANICPEIIPAASQGTMNNVIIGGYDSFREKQFTYYETIGGGMGARPESNGPPAMHSHMTNTYNTPIEAIEYTYPLNVIAYNIRDNSGGNGLFRGGDGICRSYEVLTDCQITLLTERRIFSPYGLAGGNSGMPGENLLYRDGNTIILPGKGTFNLQAGDIISISTPGGGGYGIPI